MSLFAGLDWGSIGHAVCVIDVRSSVVAPFEATHDAAGLADIVARLKRLAAPADLPVAIERPSGRVVGTLIAAGHPVVPIHPHALKACRPRYRAAGAKSGPGDGYMLTDILRTDGHHFRPLTPVSNEVKALRALVRGRDGLVAARVATANQLRSLLEGFLARLPTPESARRLGEKRMAAFMAQHRYSGRRSAGELLARLRAAPQGLAGDAEADAKGELVRTLVPALAGLVAAIRALSSRIKHAGADLPDGRIVMSFPRAGRICAAGILVELGDVCERFRTDAQLAAEAGVSPVTHASGKSRGVVFRWACNHRLRAAITCWADNSRHSSPWGADVYRRARGRGCDQPHAIRVLARAWIERTHYDPARHNAAKLIAESG